MMKVESWMWPCIIYIYIRVWQNKVYVWTVQIRRGRNSSISCSGRVIIYIAVDNHAQLAYKGKKETCVGPCPTLWQNRTEHTPIDRGVRKRKMGRACAQLVISEDLKLRETEKKDRNGNKSEDIANNNIKMLYYCIVYVKENEREKKWLHWCRIRSRHRCVDKMDFRIGKDIYINIHPIIIRWNIWDQLVQAMRHTGASWSDEFFLEKMSSPNI